MQGLRRILSLSLYGAVAHASLAASQMSHSHDNWRRLDPISREESGRCRRTIRHDQGKIFTVTFFDAASDARGLEAWGLYGAHVG